MSRELKSIYSILKKKHPRKEILIHEVYEKKDKFIVEYSHDVNTKIRHATIYKDELES